MVKAEAVEKFEKVDEEEDKSVEEMLVDAGCLEKLVEAEKDKSVEAEKDIGGGVSRRRILVEVQEEVTDGCGGYEWR